MRSASTHGAVGLKDWVLNNGSQNTTRKQEYKQMRQKRMRGLWAALLALCLMAGNACAERMLILSFTGDCTLGSEENRDKLDDSLNSLAEREGNDFFFENFRDLFSADDCTVINLEGVLSDSNRDAAAGRSFRLRGPERFVQILSDASVEAAGLANDHIMDYGSRGLTTTKETLESAGIGWARATDGYMFEKDGIRIWIFAMDYAISSKYGKDIRQRIADLKASGEASAVVVLFHNGTDFAPKHTDIQEKIGDQFVDAGADLVIMHHPHVVQGIRIRNNRTICYSLGNFVYGGNRTIRTETFQNKRQTTSLYGLVVQVRLHFSDNGTYQGQQTVLIPVYTTSAEPVNNFRPRRMTAEEAGPVLEAIQYDTQMELPAVSADEEGWARIIIPYLSAWDDGQETGNSGQPADDHWQPEKPAERPWR